MWLTWLVIAGFLGLQVALFRRGRFFFTHSLFLIPLHASVFFVDHNASRVFTGLAVDAVPPFIKLLPIYVTIALLFLKRIPRPPGGEVGLIRVCNAFLLWYAATTLGSAVWLKSLLPLFYLSFSVPLFWVFLNASNIHTEWQEWQEEHGKKDVVLLFGAFLGFILVFAAGLYYSLSAGLTTSLLDSRGVGSIFASTSAVVYCLLYAPMLTRYTGRALPYWVLVAVSVISLSKTAVLLMPAGVLMLLRNNKAHFLKHKVRYGLMLAGLGAGCLYALGTAWGETLVDLWSLKFTLGGDQTSLLEKAYETRMEMYGVAVDLIKSHPLGIGLGNFERYHHLGYRDPHNFALCMMVEGGWVMAVPFLGGLLIALLRAMRSALVSPRMTYLQFILISFLLISFSSSGVLASTGSSAQSAIYYTPFYGAAFFFHLNALFGAGGFTPRDLG